MRGTQDLRVKLFADGADLQTIERLAADPLIKGFTTNPSLMKKAGILNYAAFAEAVLEMVGGEKPVSFEVFADEPDEMIRQALIISGWGDNVYVKIPVTNTRREFTGPVVQELSQEDGIQLNVTAVMTLQQVEELAELFGAPAIVSIFAGRIADTGRAPGGIVHYAKHLLRDHAEVLWASCREIFNIIEADNCGADIVTVTPDLLAKLHLLGKDLDDYSLETVRQFHRDAEGLTL